MPVGNEHTLHVPGLPKAVVVVSTRSPKDVVLHEIGHAKTLTKPVLGAVLHASRRVSEVLERIPLSARAAGSAAAVAVMASDPDSDLAKAMPFALAASMPAVGAIPSEILASGFAIGHLLKSLEIAAAAKGFGRLTLALGTYAIPAVSAGVSAELLRRFLSRREKRASAGVNSERNTVNTTLTSKVHESFTVAADRIQQAGMISPRERMELSRTIGEMLGNLRRKMNRDVGSREMTPHAQELLKKSTDRQTAEAALQARLIMSRKGDSPFATQGKVERAAEVVSRKPLTQIDRKDVKAEIGPIVKTKKYVQSNLPPGKKGGEIYRAIRAAVSRKSPQMRMF